WEISPELSRKLLHLLSSLVAACLPSFMSFKSIALLALMFVPFMAVSRQVNLFPAIHSIERSTLGEIYFPLGIFGVAVIFPNSTLYTYGVLVMGISDCFAGIIGQQFGRKSYELFGAYKTYLGSAAFFLITLSLSFIVLEIEKGLS